MDGFIFGGRLDRSDEGIDCEDAAVPGLTARVALSRRVLEEAWDVRRAAYVAQGLVEPGAAEQLTDALDFSPSTKVFVVYKDGVAVASARACLYAPDSGVAGATTVPAMDVFHDEIVELRRRTPASSKPARVVEIARFARHPSVSADTGIVFALYHMAAYAIQAFEADAVISAIQPHHVPFYRRLGLEQIAAPRPYAKVKAQCALVAAVRPNGGELRDVVPILRLVAKDDGVFGDFVGGNRVPVYGSCGIAPSLNTIFGRSSRRTRPSHAPSVRDQQTRPEGLELAA